MESGISDELKSNECDPSWRTLIFKYMVSDINPSCVSFVGSNDGNAACRAPSMNWAVANSLEDTSLNYAVPFLGGIGFTLQSLCRCIQEMQLYSCVVWCVHRQTAFWLCTNLYWRSTCGVFFCICYFMKASSRDFHIFFCVFDMDINVWSVIVSCGGHVREWQYFKFNYRSGFTKERVGRHISAVSHGETASAGIRMDENRTYAQF